MGNATPQETPIILVPEALPVAKKHFRLNKWHVITVVLVAVIAVQGVLYLSLNSRFEGLNADHELLEIEHQNLTVNYDRLTDQFSDLQAERSELQISYSSLQTIHSSLQQDYNSLQSDYNSLQLSYNSYVSSYSNLRDRINSRTLHSSSANVKDFITPTDATVCAKVIQITGGWSTPSDWNECWSDMKKIYDWVVNNVEYRSDGLYPLLPTTPSGYLEYREEMWQFPSETLDLLQGDCEDMAILLTSMILSYNGGKYWTECIMIESSTSGHVGVQLSVEGDKLTILDPAGKYYTQISGSLDSKDISTEINNWLNYWKPQMGNDVHVDRVFSDSFDKSFSTTSEYTTWMYSR